MSRTDVQHYTAEEVAAHISEAARIVVEAELHPDFQVPAFQKAVDLLAQKTVQLTQVAPGLGGLMGLPQGRH